jgi:hypothetical protein
MLLDHLEGILNYCRTKVGMGVVEAVNGNIKSLLRRGCGYKNLGYLLLKAQRMAVTKTEFVRLVKIFMRRGCSIGVDPPRRSRQRMPRRRPGSSRARAGKSRTLFLPW